MGCLNTVIVFLLVGLTVSSTHTYRAGVVNSREPLGFDAPAHVVQNAGKANVDILVLPTPEDISRSVQKDNFDEAIKIISELAKDNKIYVVSHLFEKIRCQEKTEVIRSNLVFDRRGTVVSTYRKPLDPTGSCNTTSDISTFTTDFGVTFSVLMPEDLVLRNLEAGKNLVVAGEWDSDIALLAGPQFYKTWAYTTKANLLSSSGVFAGKAGNIGQDVHGTDFVVAELKKDGEDSVNIPVTITSPYTEDLSQYTIKYLDLAAGSEGVQETVCHGQFCCQFYLKTSFSGPQRSSYGLAAFEGIRHYGGGHNIGTQECSVLPCAGDSKTCGIGSSNSTITFEEISVTGSFKLKNSAQFPVLHSTDSLSNNQFEFTSKCENNANQVTVKLNNGQNIQNFGIFGRDFSNDFVGKTEIYDNDVLTYKIYEYINSDEVLDFVDYVWIRLRVLIFVVSIYVLEMM